MYHLTTETNPNYRLRRVFPAARTGDGPQVLLGNRHGYHNALLVRPGLSPEDRRTALTLLVDAALETLHEEGVHTAWWPFLDHASMRALRPLLGDPVPVAMKNDCVLRLPGGGFADYLARLSAKRRSTVRAERARFAAAGYRVCGRRLSESVGDVARLGVETVRRHGGVLDVESARRMTAAQAEVLDDTSVVLTCLREDRAVGMALVMDHDDTTYIRASGLDYDRAGTAAEYFELVFYRPIERAYALGITGVSLGVSGYRAKTLRGAVLRTQWALPLRVPAWPDADVRRHNEAWLRTVEAEVDEGRHAIPYADYEEHR
jgi:predicted N-acyltransferase